MDIQKRTETTDVYTALVGLDALKQVAVEAVKMKAGIGAEVADLVSEAVFDPAEGISVTIMVKQTTPVPGDTAQGGATADAAVPVDAPLPPNPLPVAPVPPVSLTVTT